MSAEPLRIHEAPPLPAGRTSLPPNLAGDRLIGRAEFQALLGISQSCFERWLAMGRLLEPIRLSKTCHRWRWLEVQEWNAAGCPDQRQGRSRR